MKNLDRSTTISDFIRKAQKAIRENRLSDALSLFVEAVKIQPEDPSLQNNIGVIYYSQGNFIEAKKHLNRAIELNPKYFDALYNLARVLVNLDEHTNALRTLEMSLTLQPNHEKATAFIKRIRREEIDVPLKSQSISGENLSSLNILFVQTRPCIRNYKMARALATRGHRVTSLYTEASLSERYPGLSEDVYFNVFRIQSDRHLWDVSKHYDIIHCHNQPDVLSVMALACEVPVIHDTHDLISLRKASDVNTAFFEGVANRGADGRIYSTPYQEEIAKQLHGVSGPSHVFYNYVSEPDLPKNHLLKLSKKDGHIHIVYEGGITRHFHRDFSSLFVELAQRGLYIHVFPASYDDDFAAYFSQFPNIHYERPVSPNMIIEVMTQFDFGIIPFNLDKENKRFLDSTIANKLFEYLAAGLPVLTTPLKSYTDYFERNPVGVTFKTADDIVNNLDTLKRMNTEIDFSQHVFTIEDQIERLEQFYRDIIRTHEKGKEAYGPLVENLPTEKALESLLSWILENGWDGYDPYDIKEYFIHNDKAGTPIAPGKKQDIYRDYDKNPVQMLEKLGIPKRRNAKALGLLVASYVQLYQVFDDQRYLDEAMHLADWLMDNPSQGFAHLCWGYPFDWQSKLFIPKGTPSSVVSTIVGDGIWKLYRVTRDRRYLDGCISICRFITENLNIDDMGENGLCFSYTPIDDFHVHNANLFCGEFLARVGKEVENEDWLRLAERTADYAISEQNADGSIFYWGRKQNEYSPDHLDHYHSGFEIRCLFGLAEHLKAPKIYDAYQKYLDFYLKHFLMPDGLPKRTPNDPFPVNIHGAAESILMLSILSREQSELFSHATKSLEWTLAHMHTSEGWFGYLWEPDHRMDAPFLRWGQAWMMRALAEYLCAEKVHSGVWGYYSGFSEKPGEKANPNIFANKNLLISNRTDFRIQVDSPLMIVGVGRSGTTLLQAILNAHPAVCFPPESHFIRDFVANPEAHRIYQQKGLEGVEKLLEDNPYIRRMGIPTENVLHSFKDGKDVFSYGALFKKYLILYALSRGKRRVGEKDPANTLYLPQIHSLFPDAKVIQIIRDPRDVIVSRLNTKMERTNTIEAYAQGYVHQFISARNTGRELFKSHYFEIYYEDLLSRPYDIMQELCQKLGLDFHERMMSFQQDAREIISEGEASWKSNVLKPIMTHNFEKWKTDLSSEQLAIVESICRDVFPQTQYELSSVLLCH